MAEHASDPATARDRAGERLPPLVRALLDAQDDVIAIFDSRGECVYFNTAAATVLPTSRLTPLVQSRWLGVELAARGGRVMTLRSGAKVLGEMIVVSRRHEGTWAEQEREAIRLAIHETGGRRLEAARRLGISRTTLWRRLRPGAK